MYSQLLLKHGDRYSYQYTRLEIPDVLSNQVLIRVLACGINNTDIWTREGLYGDDSGWNPSFKFPIIQGADIVGIIEEIGDEVDNTLLQKRVIVYPVISNNVLKCDIDEITRCKYLGSEVNGGYSTYCVVPKNNIVIIPEECKLTNIELASFPTAYMTALHMINISNIKTDDNCLVTGTSGGVGLALLQLLKLRSVKIVGISSNSKVAKLSEMTGCDIISRTKKSFMTIEKELLNYGYYDKVYDVVAGDYVNLLINVLKNNGTYVCSGAIGGRNPEIFWPNFYLKHIKMLGSMLATYDEFKELTNLIFSGKLQPNVFKSFKLKDLSKAHELFESKCFIGKIVLDCS